MLEVQNKNSVLVVDSRLVAEELGIQHRTLKDNINKFQLQFEELNPDAVSRNQALIKEVCPKNPDGSGGEVFFYLTEPQANFALTLSNNSEKAVEGKLKLIKAFELAKKTMLSVETKLPSEFLNFFNDMKKEMRVLTARTERLDAIDKATETKKGIKGVLDTEIEDCYSDDLSYTVREYLVMKKQSLDYLATMRKRAIGFWKQSCQVTELPKKGNEVLFVGNNIAFLDQALKTVLGLD